MFVVVLGAILGAPKVLKLTNRVLAELVIPHLEGKKMKKKRAEQRAAGVPEEELDSFHELPVFDVAKLIREGVFTKEEVHVLEKEHVMDIILRGVTRKRLNQKPEEDREQQAA